MFQKTAIDINNCLSAVLAISHLGNLVNYKTQGFLYSLFFEYWLYMYNGITKIFLLQKEVIVIMHFHSNYDITAVYGNDKLE